MKKLFLITIVLLLQSFPSFGEWKRIGTYNSGVIFIEVDTIRKNDDLIYYNILLDTYEPFGKFNSLSQLRRHKMNCKTKKHQLLRRVGYKNSMGKGKVTFEEDYKNGKMFKWLRLKGTITETEYQYLCE